jgi:hypothetical protein
MLHMATARLEVCVLNISPKIILRTLLGIAVAGTLVLLLASCGDDGGGSAPCNNCDFWEMAYGGVGRFPAVSPDPNVIAFASKYLFPDKIKYPFDPQDLGVGQYYHIWLAKTMDFQDTVWYYQITSDGKNDFLPAWSPDGSLIAFERNIGHEDERQILVVDVTDPENPGVPEQITDGDLRPPDESDVKHFNTDPSWVELGGRTWLSFVNAPEGLADYDMGMLSWDDLADTAWISKDPSDFAHDENDVMSFVFKDQQASSNGSRFITFSSPDRQRVGDVEVKAKSEEHPDTTVVSEILVNGKFSGHYTPYTFRYRPAGLRVRISGRIAGYCAEAGDSLVTLPDTTNLLVLDFVHTRGTLGVRSSAPNLFIYMDGVRLTDALGVPLKTSSDPSKYVFITCVKPDTIHTVHTQDVFGIVCGAPIDTSVTPGDTTFLTFSCDMLAGPQASSGRSTGLLSGYRPQEGSGRDVATLMQQQRRGIWLIDMGTDPGISDDKVYLVDGASRGANYPVLSPDGKYVAYFRGDYTSWEIVVADVSGLVAGSGNAVLHVVGLPGSSEDFECWRKPGKVSWVPLQDDMKIAVSLSPCRGGAEDDYGIWVADLSRFLK